MPTQIRISAHIRALRRAKNTVDPYKPYAFIDEPEGHGNGIIENVSTLFLTNAECPFTCLMCDLWKNTTDKAVPVGAIPAQIKYAIDRLPPADHIKLYNSGNFFDKKAIPPADYPAIIELVKDYKTVIVENHPKLTDKRCVDFAGQINGQLEVAMGLETVHPETLRRLNKSMTTDDFKRAAGFLVENGIKVRAFILLRPPFMNEEMGLEWACRSIDFAFSAGVSTCAVIPTRAGNGMIEKLAGEGDFQSPSLTSLEAVMEYGLNLSQGRVFVDLWDAEALFKGEKRLAERVVALDRRNLYQK